MSEEGIDGREIDKMGIGLSGPSLREAVWSDNYR